MSDYTAAVFMEDIGNTGSKCWKHRLKCDLCGGRFISKNGNRVYCDPCYGKLSNKQR